MRLRAESDGAGTVCRASGECGARVGEGVHANAEPRHSITSRDTDEAEAEDDRQRDGHGFALHRRQPSEIHGDDDGNEGPQNHDELALRC